MDTTTDIQSRITAATAEKQAARERYNAAAFEYAQDRTNNEKQAAVVEAKRALDLLDGELTGLQAALDGARHAESVHDAAARVARCERDQAEACAALDEVLPAFEKCREALAAFAEAYAEVHRVARVANSLALAITDDGRPGLGARPPVASIDAAVNGLAFLHNLRELEPRRTDMVMSTGGVRNWDGPSSTIASQVVTGQQRVARATQKRLAQLQPQHADVQSAAA